MSEMYVKYSEVYGKKRCKGDDNAVLDIYNELKDLFLNAYEWVNLPDTVDERYLNLQLFLTGKVAFFKSDIPMTAVTNDSSVTDGEFYVAKAVNQGTLDIYGDPKNVRAMFRNGGDGGKYKNKEELVVIYHSLARDVPQIRLWEYANKIHLGEMTIDHNLIGQKTPWIIGTTQRNLQTLKNIFKKIMRFEDTIYVSKDLNKEQLIATDIRTPYVASEVFELRKNWYTEALSYIGIESNVEKNERVVANELFLTNGKAIARRNSMLKSRMIGVKMINKIWALGIGVKATNPSIMDIMTGTKPDETTTRDDFSGGGEGNE